jgi:hypothetical protein
MRIDWKSTLVIPAQAGIHFDFQEARSKIKLDSVFRRDEAAAAPE